MIRIFCQGVICGLLLLFTALTASAQFTVSGRINDSVTGDPLPFVSVLVNNSRYGGLSDIDGKFYINSAEKPQSLCLSYLGYRGKIVDVGLLTSGLQIVLSRQSIELSGAEIFPGDNPAHRIIRKVVENRNINDPVKNLRSFSYHSYNKTTVDWYFNEDYYISAGGNMNSKDSSLMRLEKQADDQHVMMMESYTKRIFMRPALSYEEVLATRISGFRDPTFATLATDIQPFTFYGEFIELKLMDVSNFLNPAGPGGIGQYSYLICDTLYSGNDSIYVISFKPLKGKNFDGLEGVLYISTDAYAIQNVIAEPADKGLWTVRIEQKYERAGKQWFPVQLNYDWILPKYPNDKVGMVLTGRSYISDIQIDPPLIYKDFPNQNIGYGPDAGQKDETFWSGSRIDSLDSKERKTYVVMDSLGKKMKLDYITRAAGDVLEGHLPVGPVGILFEHLYRHNNSEGHRLGLGLVTNDKLAKWLRLGAYFGYGFGDEEWKYGGSIAFRVWKKKDLYIGAEYSKDVSEPAINGFYSENYSGYWNTYLQTLFDRCEKKSGFIRFRALRYAQFRISAGVYSYEPYYNYSWTGSEGDTLGGPYHFSEACIAMRYAFRDRIIDAFGKRISTGTKYPVVYLTYTHGENNLLNGQYSYNKLEAAIEKNFQIRRLGNTSFLIEGGYLWDDVPYMRMFKGKGSYLGSWPFLYKNMFQTMRPDEFLSDRYINLFFTHNFGSLLLKTRKFSPEISICNNIGFGWLRKPELHTGIDFSVPDKGFYEAGLVIDKLIKIKLLNIAYIGLGGGAFYRYGSYSFNKAIKNAAFKISLTLSSQ